MDFSFDFPFLWPHMATADAAANAAAAAAICTADLRVYFRWVSSGNNCADGPSRGSRYPGVASETLAKARHAWEAYVRATAVAP